MDKRITSDENRMFVKSPERRTVIFFSPFNDKEKDKEIRDASIEKIKEKSSETKRLPLKNMLERVKPKSAPPDIPRT